MPIVAVLVASGTSAAGADPGGEFDSKVRNYTVLAAPAICETLDAFPTESGVAGVLKGVVRDAGFSDHQAGEVVTLSVVTQCPRHTALLQSIASAHHPKTV